MPAITRAARGDHYRLTPGQSTTLTLVVLEPYKWLLAKEIDPNGNTITYRYDRSETYTGSTITCSNGKKAQGTVDRDAWPIEITWGGNTNGTPDRFREGWLSDRRGAGRRSERGVERRPADRGRRPPLEAAPSAVLPSERAAWSCVMSSCDPAARSSTIKSHVHNLCSTE